jgi:hypothetical protein
VAAGNKTTPATVPELPTVPELLLQDLAAVRTMPDGDVRDPFSLRAGL